MRVRRLARNALCALALAGCVSNPDPRNRTLEAVERLGYGGWIVMTTRNKMWVQGELISVDDGYIRVLGQTSDPQFAGRGWTLLKVANNNIERAQLYKYHSEGGFGSWGLVGSLSTASHGFLLILTLPLWLLATGIVSGAETRHVIVSYPEAPLPELAAWARFPQGIPPGIDDRRLLYPLDPNAAPPPPPAGPSTVPGGPSSVPTTGPTSAAPTPTDDIRARQARAWDLTKQAAAAARRDDCTTANLLVGQVLEIDADFHATVTMRDVAIKRCVAPRR
jgi:hypothetical protein